MNQTLLNAALGVAFVIGAIGIVVPVLPGTVVVVVAIVLWGVLTGGVWGWSVLAITLLIIALGQVLKYLLPGRSMAAAGVPSRSIMVGGLAAIAGFFLIPVVGFPVGFVGGVFAAEQVRLRDWGSAGQATWVALRATGFAMMIELGALLLAAGVWSAAAIAQA